MAGRPSGTVTFLFTDIEASTRRWEQDADAMRAALARHDVVLRQAVESRGGHVVKSTGDGMMAAFDRAGDAVDAAAGAQRALAAEQLPPVRMGVHTGETVERDGDYFGPTVNRAARLMGIGHGGQVLVSGVTQRLITEVELRDLGEHRLRDLTRPEHVFQLLGQGLVIDFPSLQSLDVLPTNLPLQLTSFVGREGEMKELRDLIADHRLVTITGVGGVGKTRLAVQLGGEVATEYSAGVWLCELAAVDDGDALVEVVALSLGVSTQSGKSLLDSVVEFLRPKQLLLIVDNCEHLLRPASALIGAVLQGCAGVTVVATSREGLGLPGEQLWPLRSLVAEGNGPADVEPSDAARLFVDRAHAVDPSFSLDASTRSPVAEICRRLDGLPLAIELAAARVGAMSVSEIASLLDERFRLLTGGRNRAVDRHQTLRGTVDWSYSLLDETARRVFDCLGVFAGSFDASAAQAVAGGDGIDRFDVLDALAELVAKSMLTVVRSESERTRYELLETLRQYALEQLDAADVDTVRRRHAGYYAELAPELGRMLQTREEIPAREQITLDLDNIRSALAWAFDRDDVDDQLLGVRIMGPLGSLASNMRSAGFGAWAERAVDFCRAGDDGLQFAVLGTAAFAATIRGDLERAKELSDEAFALGTPAECPYSASAYTARALTIYTTDLAAATEYLVASIEELERLGDQYSAVSLRSVAGMFAALAGDTEKGHTYTRAALAGARDLGNPTTLAIALFGYGLAWWQDDPESARAAIEESLEMTEAGASDTIYADALELLARVERAAGNVDRALESSARSLRESIATVNRPSVVSSLWYLAEALGLLGRDPEFGAVLHGYTTRGAEAGLMPAVRGREVQLHDQAIGALRTVLGDERFEQHAERGAAMSYDAAGAYAMTELERILTTLYDAPEATPDG